MTSHHMSPGKCKLKQLDATLHPLEWPKCRILAGEDMKQQELLFIAAK